EEKTASYLGPVAGQPLRAVVEVRLAASDRVRLRLGCQAVGVVQHHQAILDRGVGVARRTVDWAPLDVVDARTLAPLAHVPHSGTRWPTALSGVRWPDRGVAQRVGHLLLLLASTSVAD